MATIQEAIKRLRYVFTSEGEDQVAAALNKVGAAQGNVAATSTATTKASLDLEKSFGNLERRYITTVRAQQDYQKVQDRVNAAVEQHPELQARANAVLAAAAQQYGQASVGARAFQAATSGVSGQLIALSAGAGPVGVFLGALGPLGVAAAVGLGAVEKSLSLMSDAAHELAGKARELREFSEVTDLTTNQIQALRSEASKFGLTGEEVQQAVSQFTARFNELRVGQGELLTQIRRVNPALADQMAQAKDAASALTLFGTAMAQTDNIFQRNALAKAAAGRGGIRTASFFTDLNVDGLTDSYVNAGRALDQNLIFKLAQLDIDIQKTTSKARQNFASIFSEQILTTEKQFADNLLKISEWARDFKVSDELRYLLLGGAVGAGFAIGGPIGAAAVGATAITAEIERQKRLSGNITITPMQTVDVPLPRARPVDADPRYVANQLKEQIAAMGDAATAAQRLELAQKQLVISGRDAGLSAQQMTAAERALTESFANGAISARVGILGVLASASDVTLQKQYAINKANRDGAGISGEQAQALKFTAAANQEWAQANNSASVGVFDLAKAMQAADDQMQSWIKSGIVDPNNPQQMANATAILAQRVRDVGLAAQDAVPGMKELRAATDGFGQSLVSNLLNGQDGFAALTGAAKQFIATMSSDTLKRLQNGGSLFGTKDLNSAGGGLTLVSAGVSGYQSANPFAGALGGAMAGAAYGPTGLALGGLIGGISGILGQQDKAAAAEEKAHQAWESMAVSFQSFLQTLQGVKLGAISQEWLAAGNQLNQFVNTAWAAHDYAAVANAQDAFLAMQKRTGQEFVDTFGMVIEGLKNGQGLNAGVSNAITNTKQAVDALNGFIDDTKQAFAAVGGRLSYANNGVAYAQAYGDNIAVEQINTAKNAVKSYLLTLVTGVAPLTATQQSLANLKGVAAEVSSALTELGFTAGDVAGLVTQATAKIASDFTASLQGQINDATGQGFINDILKAIADQASNASDLQSLGLSTSLADTLFADTVQKTIDGAGLVGDAFGDLIKQFPQLTGVVHQSTTALQAAQDALNQSAKSITDYVHGLTVGSSSPLSPQAQLQAAQATYGVDLALARGNDPKALSSITSDFDAVLKAAQTMFGSAAGYQTIFNQGVQDLLSLPAVQQATDPVVVQMQAVLSAILAGNASQATNATLQQVVSGTAGLLTVSQVQALGLSTNTTLATLLTQSEMAALGLASNGTVAGLLTAAQLAQQNLATNPTVVGLNTTVGTLLTASELAAAGLAANTTVANLLTAAQFAQAGLATNATVSGTTGAVNTGNTTLGVIQGYTNATQANTASQISLANTQNSLINAANNLQNTSNDLLNQIASLNTASQSQLALLNQQFTGGVTLNSGGTTSTHVKLIDTGGGKMAWVDVTDVSPFGVLSSAAQFNNNAAGVQQGNQVLPASLNNSMLAALNKIVFNTYAIAFNTAQSAGFATRLNIFGIYAQGGLVNGPGTGTSDSIPARLSNGEFVMTEAATRSIGADVLAGMNNSGRVPENIIPFPVRVGASNDNGAVVSELRRLYDRIGQLEVRLVAAETKGAAAVVDGIDELTQETQGWRSDEKKRASAARGTAGPARNR